VFLEPPQPPACNAAGYGACAACSFHADICSRGRSRAIGDSCNAADKLLSKQFSRVQRDTNHLGLESAQGEPMKSLEIKPPVTAPKMPDLEIAECVRGPLAAWR